MDEDDIVRVQSTGGASPPDTASPGRGQHAAIWVLSLLVIWWSVASIRSNLWGGGNAGADAEPVYDVREIGYMGANAHDFSRVALNGRGHLAAGAPIQGRSHTVLCADGRTQDMGTLPGYPSSRAYALNADDTIAGCSYRTGGGASYSLRPTRACLWHGRQIQELPMLPGLACSVARAINARGHAVGSCYTPLDEATNAASRAVLWQGGRALDLGVLPGFVQSSALSVNDRGQVVGTLTRADSETHGFLWQDGRIRDLGTLPGCSTSMATSINSRGQIVGISGKDPVHLVMWDGGKIRDLGNIPGALSLFPIRVNAGGDVLVNAGTGSIRVGDYTRPYLWRAGAGFVQLRRLLGRRSGYDLWRGLDLNDLGQIAAGGRHRAGGLRVFLLTPKQGATR